MYLTPLVSTPVHTTPLVSDLLGYPTPLVGDPCVGWIEWVSLHSIVVFLWVIDEATVVR